MLPFILNVMMVTEVAVALILICLILMQRSKAGGGLSAMTGGAAEEVFGANTGNLLSRLTVVFSLIFMFNTLGMTVLQKKVTTGDKESLVDVVAQGQDGETTTGTTNPIPVPGALDQGAKPGDGGTEAGGNDGDTPDAPDTTPAPKDGGDDAGAAEKKDPPATTPNE